MLNRDIFLNRARLEEQARRMKSGNPTTGHHTDRKVRHESTRPVWSEVKRLPSWLPTLKSMGATIENLPKTVY